MTPLHRITVRLAHSRQPALPVQVEVVGEDVALAVGTIVAFLLTVILAVFVTYRYARGYLRTRRRPLLYLTVGLLLLAPLPMLLRLAFGNIESIAGAERRVLVTTNKFFGLLVILGVVYR